LTDAAIRKAVGKVADWQLARTEPVFNQQWTYAVLYDGFLAASKTTGDARYRDATAKMSEGFGWKLLDARFPHADDMALGQSYLDLYLEKRDPVRMADSKAILDRLVVRPDDPDKLLWWWCDALFMAPPVLAKMSEATGDRRYLDYMDHEWWLTSASLYDPVQHLYSRDASYLARKEKNGQKLFWSRGNGWVMGAFAKVLAAMPEDYPNRGKYIAQYNEMANRIASIQGKDGLWRSGLLDPENYDLPEVSGSAFFTYSLAWGINHGLLNKAKFEPVVSRAWAGMVAHIYADGRLGSIQPIDGAPGKFKPSASYVYGVGGFLLAASELDVLALQPAVWGLQLRLTNPLNIDRGEEVVEVPLKQVAERLHSTPAQLQALVAIDARSKQRIPSQLWSDRQRTEPDTLLLLVNLPAHGVLDVTFQLDPAAPPLKPQVFGRAVPERKDDFAWENEVVAYRVYGPALEATGEISSGIDVWSKRIPNFVVNDFYERGQKASLTHNPDFTYHKDNGQGLDSYDVGPSRGCGGTAVWADSKLNVSRNYTSARIIADGPIRFEFELSYAPWQASGKTVSETKRISLDAGSHLNKIVSTYTFDGPEAIELAAGIAIHDGGAVTVPSGKGIASVWDTPQDPSAGRISTGLVSLPAEQAKTLSAANHLLMIFERHSGEPFTYFAGSGWSKADMPTQANWDTYLDKFQNLREHPIAFSWTKR